MVPIFLFTDDYDRLHDFYVNILGFVETVDVLAFPGRDGDSVGIWLLNNSENKNVGVSYFGYEIETDFLSYCDSLISLGVRFELVGSLPIGYIARFFDPDGNTIQLSCESFDDTEDVDISKWDFTKNFM